MTRKEVALVDLWRIWGLNNYPLSETAGDKNVVEAHKVRNRLLFSKANGARAVSLAMRAGLKFEKLNDGCVEVCLGEK